MYWSACLILCVLSTCSGGLLRVPKVYNAIINSSDNLTPSRAFPLIQPVVHETALGYPLSPVLPFYHPELKQQQQFQQVDVSGPEQAREQPTFEIKSPPPEQEKTEGPKQEQSSKNQSQNPPKENIPLKLNEFGLPPSLVPIQNYNTQYSLPKLAYPYDPYHNYNPYFSDPYNGIILPYNNPYNPYFPSPFAQNPFNPYSIIHAPFYSIPPTQQTQQPQQPWPNQEWPQRQPAKPESSEKTPPAKKPEPPNYPPPDLNVKNNSNKNSDIPDVPPPPLPVGGLKYDNSKKPTS
ncbi:uncharacterized protein LOC143915504 [Arctopsyche grandis]|uniref:uncharacterized protein LOC143915504 n=1 Tax=Arctopsyche grandis TaxID=121162 RepID=UPI00406D8E49